jgi:hypothetical protein
MSEVDLTMTKPITPPPELMRQWLDNDKFPFETGTHDLLSITRDRLNSVINQCAAWAGDYELEACCAEVAWLESSETAKRMRERRRPEPPSLKQQALTMLLHLEGAAQDYMDTTEATTTTARLTPRRS